MSLGCDPQAPAGLSDVLRVRAEIDERKHGDRLHIARGQGWRGLSTANVVARGYDYGKQRGGGEAPVQTEAP
jgi:hypothetical protein